MYVIDRNSEKLIFGSLITVIVMSIIMMGALYRMSMRCLYSDPPDRWAIVLFPTMPDTPDASPATTGEVRLSPGEVLVRPAEPENLRSSRSLNGVGSSPMPGIEQTASAALNRNHVVAAGAPPVIANFLNVSAAGDSISVAARASPHISGDAINQALS